MEQIREILERIESPLAFLSRNSFRNISLVKDLEQVMAGLVKTLRSRVEPFLGEGDPYGVLTATEDLSEQFRGFDGLTVEEKKDRVSRSLSLIEQLREKICLRESQRYSNDLDPAGLDEAFERLSHPLQYLKGVGPKVAALFSKKGLQTIEDLLYFLPRRYEDRRFIKTIAELTGEGRETVIGTVIDLRERRYGRKVLFEATFRDDSGVLTVKWFHGNSLYLRKTFRKDRRFFLTGEAGGYLFSREMIHPDYEPIDEGDEDSLHVKRIIPLYSETEGLHQKYMRAIMMRAVSEYACHVASPIPRRICDSYALPDIEESLKTVHFPGFNEDPELLNAMATPAHRRLVFDEFFFFELGMALKKQGVALEPGIAFTGNEGLLKKFLGGLPFALTDAQARVIDEIRSDMKKPVPMNRLLQGDVGSGKTLVSMAAMIFACQDTYQAALMVPTEILAVQHSATISAWAGSIGLKTSLLTGSTRGSERSQMLNDIREGTVNIVIGTHALIQEGVEFRNLGMVVIDEQHRFGVMQRAVLREKGMHPDVLVMTATPIPRTLAMTVYGDLDVSVIDEMPPGKHPVKTKVFYENQRDRVYEIIRKEVRKGNQAFIIYPLVEESEVLDLKDATTMSRHLQEEVFPDLRIGLIHGKMKGTDKETIMADFQKGTVDVLVATTVIEVGIDIPAASLMVIEHAERFGLSQLHQLRGRVGRGTARSYCVLVAHHRGTEDARKRLRVMEETTDGFRIAEEDLSIRGPGEFMGTRQSGLPDFRVADIMRDGRLLNDARTEAFRLIEADPLLKKGEHRALRTVLLRRWGGRLELAKTG